MKTRLVALALTLCILFTLVPTALAADGEAADRPLYYKHSGTENALTNEPMEYEGPMTSFWKFYTDAAGQQEVRSGLVFEPDEGTAKDAVEFYTNGYGEWEVTARAIGTGKLVYTDGSGVRYSVAFACLLPDSGFSSSTELTKETYLVYGRASFVVGVPFYYVFPAGTNILPAVVDQCYTDGDVLSVEVLPDKPNVCKLTVTAAGNVPGWHSFRVAFTLPDESSPTGTVVYEERIALQDATPRFGFRRVRWNSGEPDGFQSRFYSLLSANLNSGYTAGFFFGEEELNVTSIEFTPAEGTDANAVTAAPNPDYPQYWQLDCVKLGSGTLVCKTADASYDLPVTVSLPNTAFFTEQRYAGDTYISDGFLYDAYKTDNAFWLIREWGFTADEVKAISLTCETWDENGQQELDPADYLVWKAVSRSGEAGVFDLKFTFVDDVNIPETGIELSAELEYDFGIHLWIRDIDKTMIRKDGPGAVTVTIDSTKYVVGFTYENEEGPTVDVEGNWMQTYPLPEGEEEYRFTWQSRPIQAATVRYSETGEAIYDLAPNEIQSRITVNKVWLERLSGSRNADGNTNTFSFAATRQLELTGDLTPSGFPIYVANHSGDAYLCAEITINGVTGTVFTGLRYQPRVSATVQLASVEEINAWLEQNADMIYNAATDDAVDPDWKLELTGTGDYVGTVVLPEKLRKLGFHEYLGISFLGRGQTFIGSFDLGGTAVSNINQLNFISPAYNETGTRGGTAIINGCASIAACSFTGYETALGGGNTLMPNNCTFTNNGTAMVLALSNGNACCVRSALKRNVFEHNDTAVQVLSTNDFVTPYRLRFVDSAFLNNTTDFDVQTAGTFYFLRNYFADGDTARQAKISTSNGAKVYADLVWTASPLTTAADARQLVLNRTATALPNDADTQATAISADALTAETQIDLANESGETVASWSGFGSGASTQRAMRALRAADAGAADGFRPGVDILQSGGTLTITVPHSTALQSKHPLLTVPCAFPDAAVTVTGPDGKPVAYTLEKGNLSFRVSAGGTYTVTAQLPQAEYADGVITVKNAPAEAELAIAAVYNADDQLLQTAVAAVQNGAATLELPVQTAQTCRVFLLDQGNKPVCSTIEP